MEKLIFTDCDDILLNGTLLFKKFLEEAYGLYSSQDPFSLYPTQWDILGGGSDLEKFKKYNEEFIHTDAFRMLPPEEGAIDGIKRLKKAGYQIVVVTSVSSNPAAKKAREENLKNVFGDVFKEVHCLEPLTSKTEQVLKHYPGCFFIEDSVRNIIEAADAGLRPILMRRKFNSGFVKKFNVENRKDVKICSDWPEITVHIEKANR